MLRACVQGRFCARRPGLVLAVAAAVVALCALGLVRLRVETDPQRLWVGAGSQAAREKADYEARAAPRQGACTGAALPACELAAPLKRTLQSPRSLFRRCLSLECARFRALSGWSGGWVLQGEYAYQQLW
jgi:hypothetical protein